MPYKTTEIVIRGSLQGPIWWPVGAICHKDFKERFRVDSSDPFAKDWPGMREALLDITNDGDFQHCKIASATLIVTRSNGSTERRKYIGLIHEKVKDSDLFVAEEEFEEIDYVY